jgi:hypothetical protein
MKALGLKFVIREIIEAQTEVHTGSLTATDGKCSSEKPSTVAASSGDLHVPHRIRHVKWDQVTETWLREIDIPDFELGMVSNSFEAECAVRTYAKPPGKTNKYLH